MAVLGMASPAIPFTPDTRPSSRRRIETGWPKFRRDRAQMKEIEQHNRAVEQKKRDRLEARQVKRNAA